MKSVKAFFQRFSLLSAVLFTVLTIAFTEIPLSDFLERFFEKQTAFYLAVTFQQGLCAAVAGVLLVRMGILRRAGLTGLKKARLVWLVWPILILTALNGFSLFDGTLTIDTSRPHILALFVLIALSTGFYEEIVCRGLILSACLKKWGRTKKGIYLAVIATSLIFGLLHFTNFIAGRGSLLQVGTQTLYAVFFGVFFAACFLRQGSLWPAIITHALFDMAGTLSEVSVGHVFSHDLSGANADPIAALITIAVTLPLFIYGLIILRKVQPQLAGEQAGQTVSSSFAAQA